MFCGKGFNSTIVVLIKGNVEGSKIKRGQVFHGQHLQFKQESKSGADTGNEMYGSFSCSFNVFRILPSVLFYGSPLHILSSVIWMTGKPEAAFHAEKQWMMDCPFFAITCFNLMCLNR